jgi:DNA replication protein DnaC
MSTAAPTLAADLTAGLKRLKMAGMRRLAPELLVTAKTQRWNPEEFLRTLVEAEIAARDESNARTRRRQACFPVSKTLEEFDLMSGYDLTCRSGYDLTCRFRQGDHVMGSLPATRVRRSLSR